MKLLPKKTPLTPSILKSWRASGDPRADIGLGKSMVLVCSTGTPGRNFRLFGLGVSWIWTNMPRAEIVTGGGGGGGGIENVTYSIFFR